MTLPHSQNTASQVSIERQHFSSDDMNLFKPSQSAVFLQSHSQNHTRSTGTDTDSEGTQVDCYNKSIFQNYIKKNNKSKTRPPIIYILSPTICLAWPFM